MRFNFFAPLLLAVSFSTFAQSTSEVLQNCKEVVDKPSVSIKLGNFPEVKIIRKPLVEVNKIARNSVDLKKHVTSGATQLITKSTPDLYYSYNEYADAGLVCSSMQLDIYVDYAEMNIYIASELDVNGEAYKAVLAHEMEHVEIYKRDFLNELKVRAEKYLNQNPDDAFALEKSIDKVVATHTKQAWGLVDGALQVAIREVAKEHIKFDDAEAENKEVTKIIANSGDLDVVLNKYVN